MATVVGLQILNPVSTAVVSRGESSMRCTVVQQPVGAAGTLTRLGAWLRRESGDGRCVLAVWDVSAGKPGRMLARTAVIEAPATGRAVDQPVRTPASVKSSDVLAFGVVAAAGEIAIGQGTAACDLAWKQESGGAVGPFTDSGRERWQGQTRALGIWGQIGASAAAAAGPSAPSALAPADGSRWQGAAGRPLLTFRAVDPGGRAMTGQGELQLLPSGTVRPLVFARGADGQTFACQTTAADLAAAAAWQWRARAAAAGIPGPWSGWRQFDWEPGLTVTVTAPTGVVATASPDVSWTVAGLGGRAASRWQARLLDPAGRTIRQTRERPGDPRRWRMPAGWIEQGGRYALELEVWGGGRRGERATTRFEVRYPAGYPAVSGLTATPTRIGPDVEPSVIRVGWEPSAIPPNRFGGYLLRRRAGSDPWVVLARIEDPAQAVWWDASAPGNAPLTYRVTAIDLASGNGVETEAAEASLAAGRNLLTVPTLSSVADGVRLRFPLVVLGEGLSGSFERETAEFVTWGSRGRPALLGLPGNDGARSWEIRLTLHPRDGMGAVEQRLAIEAVVQEGGVLCFRTGSERAFVTVSSFSWARRAVAGTLSVDLSLREIDYVEGIDLS